MVRFLLFFLFSFNCFAQAIVSSPLTEIAKGNYQFKILFLNETSRIPFVNFDIQNGMLVRRSHSRTIRGYELSFIIKKKNHNKQLVVENIIWIKNGVRRPISSVDTHLKSPSVDVGGAREIFNNSSQTKILTEINSDLYYFQKGIIIKYSILSKSNYLDYKISKFPQFNGFIKRFREISSRSKQVFIDGEYWYQNPLYLVEIFPIDGKKLKIFPMSVELKKFGRSIEIKSESFSPSIQKVFDEDVLYGDNEITLFPGEGNSYDANHPVSILVEISGNGLIENYEPVLSDNIKKYLVSKTIEKQSYGIPKAKKIINFRFSFPVKGSYSGSFSIKSFVSNKVITKNKEFAFDILAPKATRKFLNEKRFIRIHDFLNISAFVKTFGFILLLLLFCPLLRREFNIVIDSISLYKAINRSNGGSYGYLFKTFYKKVETSDFQFLDEGNNFFKGSFLEQNNFLQKMMASRISSFSASSKPIVKGSDFSFFIIYIFVRKLTFQPK